MLKSIIKSKITKLLHLPNIFFFLMTFCSCNFVTTKTEEQISENIKEKLTYKKICDNVRIENIRFDNSSGDNSGSEFSLKGFVNLSNDIEREIVIDGNLFKENSWRYTIKSETEESMIRRIVKILTSNSFDIENSSEVQMESIKFESDNLGYYKVSDGDQYSFNYTLTEPIHYNEFPDIEENLSCDEIQKSVDIDKQCFKSNFEIKNSKFILNGTIKIDSENGELVIKGRIESLENSKTDELDMTFSFH